MRVYLKNGDVIDCSYIKRSWETSVQYYKGDELPGHCSGEFDLADVVRIEDEGAETGKLKKLQANPS